MLLRNYVVNVREALVEKYQREEFVIDKTGVKTIELINASFIANEDHIFGKVNHDYVARELQWYKSQSLKVADIPGEVPAIWKAIASKNGEINSNYGWAILSRENHDQFANVVHELKNNPLSRRAAMIYNRPSMWNDYNRDGMSDFMCTFSTQHYIRNGVLETSVFMRSNDAWAGYRNDWHWQNYVHNALASELNVPAGKLYWNVGSIHVYEKQFYLVDHYMKTGETHITKAEYDAIY
jgi:thymidylate synthase